MTTETIIAARHQGSVTMWMRAPADEVFGLIVDIGRLPEWNAQLPRVVAPTLPLAPGSEWVVVQRGLGPGIEWTSRARVIEIDHVRRSFNYRSRSESDNPSFAIWAWTVVPAGTGCRVTVGWQLNPRTFWRRVLGAPLRQRQLSREVCMSLTRLSRMLCG